MTQMIPIRSLDVEFNSEVFLRDLIHQLSGVLEEKLGTPEAAGFVSIVGQKIGEQLDKEYKQALQVSNLDRLQVAEVMVDLKRRISGDFRVIEANEDRIVLGNRACPFGDRVLNRPSLCMMTSNVFGFIAAQNLGYARVDIQNAIARGDKACRVVVHLTPSQDSIGASGREFFGS